LGVIFHFTANDKRTTVQAPADMVKEAWVCIILAYASGMKLQLTISIDSSRKLYRKSQISSCLQVTCLWQMMTVGLFIEYFSDTCRFGSCYNTGPLVFNAVRAVHPTTPIIILGGG
jgi:hypothetical protein